MGIPVSGEMRHLHLPVECLDALRDASYEGLRSLPRRGAEIGGLIVGTADGEGVEFVPFESEHLFGPAYSLSPHDLSGLRRTVAQLEAEGKPVAAFFRSCTARPMQVEQEDRSAIAAACPSVQRVVLATAAYSGSAVIRTFTREAGDAWMSGEEISVPPVLTLAPRKQPSVEKPVERVQTRTPQAQFSPPAPAVTDRSAWLFCAFALCVTLAAGGYWYSGTFGGFRGSKAIAPADEAHSILGLAVNEQDDGALRIVWNPASAAARSASTATLDITDDRTSRSVPLLMADFHKGWISYAPESAELVLRLKVGRRDGPPVEEILRVVGNQVVERSGTPPPAAEKRTVSIDAPPAAPVAAFPLPPIAAPAKPQAVVAMAEAPAPQFDVPMSALRSAGLPSVTLPPAPRPASVAPPVAAPAVRVSFTPPVPLHQVAPLSRGLAAQVVEKPVTVGIIVSVDDNGRVTAARPDAGHSSNGYLVGLALNAARQWTFRPATRAGAPVAAEQRLEFAFHPSGQ